MNRATVASLAGFEALIAAAIGIGVALAPLSIVWAVQFHMAADWTEFWRASVDAWLLGHGVDLTVSLDKTTAVALGLGGAIPPFTAGFAALGIAFLTFAMGTRTGQRAAEAGQVLAGGISAVAVFFVVAQFVGLSAIAPLAAPVWWQAGILPALVMALGIAFGVGLDRARGAGLPGRIPLPVLARTVVGQSLRAGTAALAIAVFVAAFTVAMLLFTHFGQVVALYEALQSGYLGGTTLTLVQFALLPNAVVWQLAWFAGPGFSVGAMTVTPGAVHPATLPAFPLFGILPDHGSAGQYAGVLVIVLAGVLAGVLLRSTEALSTRALAAVGSGIAVGIAAGLLSWWSGGTVAPGVLERMGPDGLVVGLFAALESAIGVFLGELVPPVVWAGAFRRGARVGGRVQPPRAAGSGGDG